MNLKGYGEIKGCDLQRQGEQYGQKCRSGNNVHRIVIRLEVPGR